MSMLSSKEKKFAYIAGLFDGEGCIYIAKQCGSYGKRYHAFYLSLTITNTHLETLEWIIRFTGFGKIYSRPPTPKQCYVYQLGKMSEILAFLESIYPYLHIKKMKAEIVMDYCRLRLSKLKLKYNARFGEEEKILQKQIEEVE